MTRTRTKASDPFERAVRREQRLRRQAGALGTRAGVMRMAFVWFTALGVGWLLLIAAHWLFFADPRWLAITHTIVFALTVGMWIASAAFYGVMHRRRPDLFDLGEVDDVDDGFA